MHGLRIEMETIELRWRIGTKERTSFTELIKHTGHRHHPILCASDDSTKRMVGSYSLNTKVDAVNPQHRNYLVSNGPFLGNQQGILSIVYRKRVRQRLPMMLIGQRAWNGISAHGLRKAFAAQQAEQESSISEIAATVVTGCLHKKIRPL